VQFMLDGNAIGGVQTLVSSGADLTASLVVGAWDVLPLAPGSYTVTAVFTGRAPTSTPARRQPRALTVASEDARAAYTGATYVSTASASSSTATVLLSATIQDITAVLPGSDAAQGDISNATVTFIDRDTNLPIAHGSRQSRQPARRQDGNGHLVLERRPRRGMTDRRSRSGSSSATTTPATQAWTTPS
jgi:hypothetical protein